MDCPVTAYTGYIILLLDKDDNTYKATMMDDHGGEGGDCRRVIFDHNKVIMDFHTEDDGNNKTNYVIIPESGVLAILNSKDEDKLILGDK